MNKLFTLCSAAAVLAATSASAQMSKSNQATQQPNPCTCLEQGMGLPTEKKCFPAAYNAPASIAVRCGWDFDVFGSFIYWHVSEEGLSFAFVQPRAGSPLINGQTVYPDFTYKPGFQAGVGFNTNYDDWVGWAEYTWMHQSVTTTKTAPPRLDGTTGTWGGVIPATVTPLASDWFPDQSGVSNSYTVASSLWKMHLDMLDVMFSRPYYEGTQLTVSPYAGLRALWIRQNMKIAMTQSTTGNIPTFVANLSHSWAIGPAVGTEGHWLLGSGFRFEGNATGAILYTQYTRISCHMTFPSTSGAVSTVTNYNTLRTMGQLGVGLGWGSYLDSQKYYLDFTARYDFNYLWNQNVMRQFVSELVGRENDCGDLMLHGLTVSARFDF